MHFSPSAPSALLFYFRGSFIDADVDVDRDTKNRRNAPLTELDIQFRPLSNPISFCRHLLDVFVALAIV